MLSINESRCVNCGACVRACPMGIFQLRKGAVRVGTQRHCILCYHCSAACPRQAIELEGVSHEAFYPPKPQAPVQELVRSKRRAIRHFTDKLPEKGQLLSALEGAEYAPSAKNRRPYRWRCSTAGSRPSGPGSDRGLVQRSPGSPRSCSFWPPREWIW